MTSKNRVGATIQMVYGADDDLIGWYSSLPTKERHQSLKTALRAGVGLADSTPNRTAHPIGVVAPEQLEALRNELYAEWSTWTRQLVDSLPGYVQEHVERALSATGVETPVVESAPQLTNKEVDQRVAKLKKASW
ncbi:MAG: hypothetical protein K8L97_25135 [Anaerolineae bacterium]|nr:hypothetical protein [Anaerolineae bacterium]